MAPRVPSEESIPAIAERLRLIRLAYGNLLKYSKPMSQAELARLTGIGAQAWNNFEKAFGRIGLDNAKRLWRRTGADLNYIYAGDKTALPHALAIEIEKIERKEALRPAKRA